MTKLSFGAEKHIIVDTKYLCKDFHSIFLEYLTKGGLHHIYIKRLINSLNRICLTILQEKDCNARSAIFESILFTSFRKITSLNTPIVSRIIHVLNEIDFINSITYCLDQTKECECSIDDIDIILDSCQNTNFFKSTVIFLFRINKSYISSKYILDCSTLSVEELYYGISSGYFYYIGKEKEAYDSLFNLFYTNRKKGSFNSLDNPESAIKKLIQDGLLTSFTF